MDLVDKFILWKRQGAKSGFTKSQIAHSAEGSFWDFRSEEIPMKFRVKTALSKTTLMGAWIIGTSLKFWVIFRREESVKLEAKDRMSVR